MNKIGINLLYATLTILFGSFLSSCGEDYLEEADVFRDLDATTAYQSQEDAVLAVSAAYTPLQYQGLYRRYRYLLDYMSGDLDITSGGFQLTEYPGFNFNPSSQHLIPSAWSACFTGIMRANVVLEKVPDIQFQNEELKPRILAEARFLRGFYYFELARLYGGVPIYERS
ncbi:MAG: RagB/SusD family nutrient uptake outer membrane protein, partial [Bacteroidota bacterium]